MIVYCTGSQYNPEEIEGMTQISSIIERSGYHTYLPHRDGLEHHMLNLINRSIYRDEDSPCIYQTMTKAVFALEVFQVVERCDALLFNMNGRVPEEGAVFKSSLAFMTGKAVVVYKNDNRSVFYGNDNAMITGLSMDFKMVKKLHRIPAELIRSLKKVNNKGPYCYATGRIPVFIQRVLILGEKVWRLLNEMQLDKYRVDEYLEKLTLLKEHLENLTGFEHISV